MTVTALAFSFPSIIPHLQVVRPDHLAYYIEDSTETESDDEIQQLVEILIKVGCGVGGAVVSGFITALVCCACRRKKRYRKRPSDTR